MTRNILILLLCLALSACNLLYDEEKTMQEAAKAQKSGAHSEAIIAYKKVLKNNGNNHRARVFLARSYLMTGQGASAEKELKRAVVLGVPERELLVLLARSILLQRDYERFLARINLELAINQQQYDALFSMRGRALLGVGNLSAAESIFNKVLSQNKKNVDALAALADIDQQLGRFSQAEAKLSSALSISSERYDVWLQKAALLQQLNKSAEAAEIYRNVMGAALKNNLSSLEFRCRLQLTNYYLQIADFDRVKEQIDVLGVKAKDHPFVWYLRGAYNYQQKKYDEARIDFEKVLLRIPNHEMTLLLLGASQFGSGNYEQANEYLTRFINLQPTHIQARKLLGATRLYLYQPEQAFDVLKYALSKDNSNDASLLLLAGKAALQSKNIKAIEYIKKSAELSPENSLIRKGLAEAYLQEGDFEKAIDELSKIKGKEQLNAKSMIIQAYLQKNDYQAASKSIVELLSNHSEEPVAYYIAASAENAMGNRSQAYHHLRKSVELKRDFTLSQNALARLYIEDGEFSIAVNYLNGILAVDSKNVDAMLGFVLLEDKKGNHLQSLKWLENARNANRNAIMPRIMLANYYSKINDYNKALEIANEAVSGNPESPQALMLLGKIQVKANKLASAEQTYSDIAKRFPTLSSVQIERVKLYTKVNNFVEARSILKKLIEKNPRNLKLKIRLANLEIAAQKPDAALNIARELKAIPSTKYIGESLAGDVYMSQRKYNQAITAFKIAYKNKPNPNTAIAIARAYDKVGKRDKAIIFLKNVISTKNANTQVHIALGSMYQHNDQNLEALNIYERLLEQNPKNASVLNNMALALLKTDNDKALNYAIQANNLLNDHPVVKDTLGWVYFHRGEYDKSMELLKDASLALDEPTVDYHYAAILVKFGDTNKAVVILEKILANHEAFAERDVAEKLLAQIK